MATFSFSKYQLVPASFNPWRPIFLEVGQAIIDALSCPKFEFLHFGSSSFKVAGKGIIDISILYQPGQRELAVQHLKQFGFVDQHSDKPFPDSRPRKDAAVIYNNETFLVHAHVIELASEEHEKQRRFKAFMLEHPEARAEYEAKKRQVLAQGIVQQDEYGKAKSPFVKSVLNNEKDDSFSTFKGEG